MPQRSFQLLHLKSAALEAMPDGSLDLSSAPPFEAHVPRHLRYGILKTGVADGVTLSNCIQQLRRPSLRLLRCSRIWGTLLQPMVEAYQLQQEMNGNRSALRNDQHPL